MIPRIVYLVIFLSGFASLGYELCWIRKGALLIGATPHALSIVLAVFFAGLAGGAWLFGLLSRRTGNALRWYGLLECGIGLMAAFTPLLFRCAGELSVFVFQVTGISQNVHLLVRSALITALLLPVCVLIGGTLPLLCQFSINTRQADIRFAAATIYAVNTFGAFFGCMVCGLWFIPFWGIDAALRFNALLSFIAGSAILIQSGTLSAPVPTSPAVVSAPPEISPGGRADARLTEITLYVLFFWAGFAALGYELVWVRFLSLIIHNTVYTCIFSLGAILLGIAVGGMLAFVMKERPGQDVLLFGAANIFIGIAVLFILTQPVAAWDWIRNSRSVALQAVLCVSIIFIPSVASGISFPLAYRLVATNARNSGRDFGFLTAVSTAGGIAGSLLVGFWLLPSAGMSATVTILTCMSVVIGAYAILVFADGVALLRRVVMASAATALWGGLVFFCDTGLPQDFLAGNRTLIEFSEGISSFIAVAKQDGDKILEIDRMWQGQNKKGHQILAAHIPMMLHEDPKRVLVVGMGTGQTASRFLMYNIERLDCVDIEKTLPGMLRRHFDAAWLNDRRTQLITDDGRSVITYTKSMFDIISIEVGQSFRPQIASFYTVDFYQDVKKRLAKNGLACQFVPVGFFTEEEFRGVVRSFLEVFPHSTLWLNKYAELILIGAPTHQPQLSMKRLGLLQSVQKLRTDLDYSFGNKPAWVMNQPNVFAAHFLMGSTALSRLSVNAPQYRDDRPILEYQTARTIYSPGRFHDVIEKNLESPETVFADKIPAVVAAHIAKIRAENVHDILSGGASTPEALR